MAAEKNSWSFRRRLLFDFHMPDFLEELKVDVPEYLADLKEINAQSLTLMTKSSFGNCYYQSRIGQKAKGLKGDLLKKMIPRLRQQGMEVIAYYNASLSDIESQKHPEWRAINSQGQKVRFEYYDQLCLNSPLKEFVVQQAREIVENYEVDGFWLDLTYMAAGGCFCPWCQKLFQERYGLKLTPEIKKDPASNRLFQEFRRSSRFDFIKAVHTALKEIKPSLLLGWNHAGDFYFNEIEIDRLADYSSVEFHPPLYAEGSIRARYLRKLGKPFELMIPETLSGWGDWTLLPEPTMKLMATLCLMHGGSINIGHVVPPCGEFAGRLAPAVKQTIKKTFRWVKKIAPFCTGESVPINAIFYSAENSRLVNALPEAESDFSRNSLNTLFGLGKILLASQLHFDVLGQEQISQIHRYEVLLLPDIRYLSPGVEKEIITYVEKGGKLLATYLSGFWDQQGQLRSDSPAARLFGVRFENFSPYSINYLYHFDKKIAAGLPDMPILVNQTPPDKRSDRRSVLVRPTTAQVLAYLVEPVIESDHEHYFHIYHRYSPPGKTTRYPAITFNRFGRGKVVYLSFPAGAAYSYSHSPWLKRVLLNCLRHLNPYSRLQVQAPSTVEVNLTEKDNIWFLHLLDTSLTRISNYQEETGGAVTVSCTLRKPGVTRVTSLLTGEKLPLQRRKNKVSFSYREFSGYQVLKIE